MKKQFKINSMKNNSTKFLFGGIALLTITSFVACKKDKADDPVYPTVKEFEVVMSNVKADPTVARVSGNSHTVFFLGDKDANGLAINIKQIVDYFDGEQSPTLMSVDEQGRPTAITTNQGVFMEFSWLTDTKARIKLISPDNSKEANIEIDFAVSQKSMSVAPKTNDFNIKKSNRSGRNIAFTQFENIASGSNLKGIANATNPMLVAIKSCNSNLNSANLNPYVEIKYDISTQAAPGMIVMHSSINASNEFVFDIPDARDGIISTQEFCTPIANILGALIRRIQQLSGNDISSEHAEVMMDLVEFSLTESGFVNDINGQPIISSRDFINSMIRYNEVFGADMLFDNSGSFATTFCENSVNAIDNLPEKYTITTKVFIPGEGIKTDEKALVPTSGPFEKVEFQLPETIRISDFKTEPGNPEPGQDYVASAQVDCADGQNFSISIVGSDGFEDSVTGTISGNDNTVTLTVPGGAADVHDVITIIVGDQTKTIEITF